MMTPSDSRSTKKPCPCGSGLLGIRNLRLDSSAYVCCAKCQPAHEDRAYLVRQNEDAAKQAKARRRIEDMRDEAYAAGEGEVW